MTATVCHCGKPLSKKVRQLLENELRPPGSHLQANASVIYEEEEEEPERTEELPLHFVQRRLDYVTRRNARAEEKSLRDRCSSPLTQLPDKTGSTDDLNLQTTRFMMSAESLLDMLQAVPTASTPVCPPEASPRRRSARRRSSTVAGMPLLTASMFNRRRSEKVPQMSPTRPGPSRSPQHPSIPGDGSSRTRTSPGVERPSSRQDSRDNPHGAWLESSVGRMRRRASQAVSYKEPKINSKLRRP
ncbi:uncharacterized protein LOC135385899 [Ornithodoros turicata]|uniref:uncharacterized protein LOC135385899 n=1 Tax=Ornithodoros turicata TaxID=34597 RepID=UPI00313A36B2